MVALSIQTYGVATAFSTGMVFTLPENGIFHSPERHRLELHPGGRVAKILLHSGEVAKDHDVIEIIHRETFIAEIINDHIVVLLRKLPFLFRHRPQSPHAFSAPFDDRA